MFTKNPLSLSMSSTEEEKKAESAPAEASSPVGSASRMLRAAVFAAVLSGSSLGYNNMVSLLLVESIPPLLKLTATQTSILASSNAFGAVAGCVMGFYANDRIGRRSTTLVGETIILIGALVAVLYLDVWSISFGRLITGIGNGVCTVTKPLYVAELAPAAHRGKAGALFSVASALAMSAVYVVHAILPGQHLWRIEVLAGCVPAALLIALTFALPKSPIWLMLMSKKGSGLADKAAAENEWHGNDDEQKDGGALTVLGRRTPDSSSSSEMGRPQPSEADITRRATLVVAALACGQQLTLSSIVMTFAESLLVREGTPSGTASTGMMLMSFAQSVGAIVAVALIDSYGRRILLVGGLVVSSVLLLVSSVAHAFAPGLWQAQIVALATFLFAYQCGVCATYWVLCSELFPPRRRAFGSAFGAFLVWLLSFVTLAAYPATTDFLDVGILTLIGALVGLLVAVFVARALPETKGVDLVKGINKLWRNHM